MKKRQALLCLSIGISMLLFTAAVISIAPHQAHAETGNAVSRGYSTTPDNGLVPCTGTDCQACSIVGLIQNLINFALGLSIPIVIGMFAWAGILYFTSAASGENVSKAKRIFTDSLTGFIIALGAYLIIQTILHTILAPQYFSGWNSVTCVNSETQRPGTTANNQKNLGDLLNEVLGTPQASTVITNTSGCPAGTTGDYHSDISEYICVPSAGISLQTVSAGVNNSAQYSPAFLAACKSDSSCAATLQAICAVESGCGTNVGSNNGCNGAGACGMMQIEPATACATDPSFSLGMGCNADGSIKNLTAVQQALQGANSIGVAAQIYAQSYSACGGSLDCAIAAYNGGSGATAQSVDCPSGVAKWECPYDSLSPTTHTTCYGNGAPSDCKANTGYVQTRNYVPAVQNAISLIKGN